MAKKKAATPPTAATHYARVHRLLENLNPKQAPAMFANPLFRLKLVKPENTQLGYHLIDVIAIAGHVKDQTSKFQFPYYVCLALCSDGHWTDIQITDAEGHIDLEEAYEVVA